MPGIAAPPEGVNDGAEDGISIGWPVGTVPVGGGIAAIEGDMPIGIAIGGGAIIAGGAIMSGGAIIGGGIEPGIIGGGGIDPGGIGGGIEPGGIEPGAPIGEANIGAASGGTDPIEAGIGSGIEAGIGSGDDDGLRKDAPVTTAIGCGVRSGLSDAVVTSGFRSSGSAIGSVEGLLSKGGATEGLEPVDDAKDALEVGFGGMEALALGFGGMEALAFGGTEALVTVRGATDTGAGGATEGARGAMGAWLARAGIDAWLARGAIDAGFAAVTGARPDASDMRRVPGAALTGGGESVVTALTGGASRSLVSWASAAAMSGGRPCAVAASS